MNKYTVCVVGSLAIILAGAVTAAAADYDANVLVLEGPVSFAADAPVSLPYHGAAPDMGAIEFSNR